MYRALREVLDRQKILETTDGIADNTGMHRILGRQNILYIDNRWNCRQDTIYCTLYGINEVLRT
jgi:hypothetical protein